MGGCEEGRRRDACAVVARLGWRPTYAGSAIEQWWAKLRPSTQEWLIGNNGDAVPAEMVAEIAGVGGPASVDAWWVGQSGTSGRHFPDEGVDWVEAIANEENPG